MRNFMRVLLAITVMGAIALSLVGGVAAGYQLYYQDRIYPGVHFAASDLSGLTKLEAAEAIRQQFQYNQQNAITLRYGDRTWQMTPLDLGLVFDLDGTVNRAYAYGRSGVDVGRFAKAMERLVRRLSIAPHSGLLRTTSPIHLS
jgi:hypothetical protein